VRGAFDDHGVALRLDLPNEPLWVDADQARVAQVVENLLGNALKFTPRPGDVQVTLSRVESATELRVRDTGMGIDPGSLEKIFEPFAQIPGKPGTSHGGMGIGLALVKNIVTLHGGTARALSEGRDRGAELIVSLPLAEAPVGAMAKPAAVAVPSLSILLVEDNRDAGETLEQLLQLEGHRTRLALDGKAATEVFLEQAPEVLISDVGLPDVSGYELLRRLRQLEGGARVFAIALTGYAQPDDVERAKEAGFDAHLPKPAPLERLDELLATAALRRATGAGERSPPSP
jgi:CheY-like chemotaxis protein